MKTRAYYPTPTLMLLAVIAAITPIATPAADDKTNADAKAAGQAIGDGMHEIGMGAKNLGLAVGEAAKKAGLAVGEGATEFGRAVAGKDKEPAKK